MSSPVPDRPCIHVIDDDESMRDSLEYLFDTVDMPARTYESAAAFLATVDEARGGCVVTDVRMPGMSGIELLRELKSRGRGLPVIVITGHGDVPLAVEAMREGAVDFLEKPFANDQLLASIRRALAQPAPRTPGDEQGQARAKIARLSARERQVFGRLAAGQLNKTIAHDLGISIRTVEVYRAKVMEKMECESLPALIHLTLGQDAIRQ